MLIRFSSVKGCGWMSGKNEMRCLRLGRSQSFWIVTALIMRTWCFCGYKCFYRTPFHGLYNFVVSLKWKIFNGFGLVIYTTTLKKQTFEKRMFLKCMFLEILSKLPPCNLQKHDFVKTATHCMLVMCL